MIEFLNTQGLREWIPRMIHEAQKEMIIIVPFIKTSENMYQALLEADQRGVETLIVYREESLKPDEKRKLTAISNLNLLHHPNVHAKCYMNETHLLITSMNMYEFSAQNNREMGILLEKNKCRHKKDDPIEAALNEIQAIITSSTMEKESRETMEVGFDLDIIKTQKDKAEEFCQVLNKAFVHKKFIVEAYKEGYQAICKNYSEGIDLIVGRQAKFVLFHSEDKLKRMYKGFPVRNMYYFEGYKFYWNNQTAPMYLYPDNKCKIWNDLSEQEQIRLMRKGIDTVIAEIRKV